MDAESLQTSDQIVYSDEDAEFVECLDCREVFESSEFKDMAIEEQETDEA